MTLPASFLQHIEQHPCFTGCYSSASGVQVCYDPNLPLAPLVVVSCRDCFAYFAVAAALLPSGVGSTGLADQLTQHVRLRRGFVLSVSGYFTNGPGFWFSAAYLGGGLFLVGGERSRKLGSDLDQLLLAFQHGVLSPPDPRVLDRNHYSAQTVYGHFAAPAACSPTKQGLFASPQISTQPQPGWQKLTLLECLPLAAAPVPVRGTAPTLAVPIPAARPLKPGDVCPKCGAEVRSRQLLNNTYVGCLC